MCANANAAHKSMSLSWCHNDKSEEMELNVLMYLTAGRCDNQTPGLYFIFNMHII